MLALKKKRQRNRENILEINRKREKGEELRRGTEREREREREREGYGQGKEKEIEWGWV